LRLLLVSNERFARSVGLSRGIVAGVMKLEAMRPDAAALLKVVWHSAATGNVRMLITREK